MKTVWKAYFWLCGLLFGLYLVVSLFDPAAAFVQHGILEAMFLAFTGAFFLLFVFLPSIIATHRDHPSRNAIIIMNIFLGWTFIFWVIALMWANADNKSVRVGATQGDSVTQKLEELENLLAKRKITWEEYRSMRAKILDI